MRELVFYAGEKGGRVLPAPLTEAAFKPRGRQMGAVLLLGGSVFMGKRPLEAYRKFYLNYVPVFRKLKNH